MYVKSDCPYENRTCYHELRFRVKKEILLDGEEYREHRTITGIEITDTKSEEELVQCIINELQGIMYNGISTNELCKILKEKLSVLEQYCCDLVQQLKIELDMYCPDRQHLYYVEARFS
ncbi:hypothetical protein [uncultured Methanolobus sp.]|uniref:hypothetical protein n=1 Tax=uncultured Methanolobus sp. TaxID=218300 RepID=UPI0029C7CC5D|nr:hypothetical protein [uncultured Methanolobus sp.]